MPSDIHVFVRFKEPSVFAGEDVECTITFKNVANLQNATSLPEARTGSHSRRASLVEQVTSSPRVTTLAWHKENPRLAGAKMQMDRNNFNRSHKATTSLSFPASSGAILNSPAASSPSHSFAKSGHKHQRSVSIISIGSSDVEVDHQKPLAQKPPRPRPDLSHRRASTVQNFSERFSEPSERVITGKCGRP